MIHARIRIAGVERIGNDVPPERYGAVRSSYPVLSLDSPQAAEEAIRALADGGSVTMPMEETFFATGFAQVRDRFGVLWTILHERPR